VLPTAYAWEATNEQVAQRYAVPIESIVRFDLNTSPTPPALVDRLLAAGQFDAPLSEYPPSDYRRLTEAAAARYGVATDELLVGAGADEILDLVAKAFLAEGARAVLPAPTYAMYRVLTEQRGADVVVVPRRPATEGWALDVHAVREVYLNSEHLEGPIEWWMGDSRGKWDGDTLVVGAGNSGAEIALEASREHRVLLSGRDTGQEPLRAGGRADRLLTPPFWFLLTRLLTVKTPMGRKVSDRFRSRGLPLARVRRKDLAAAGIERVPRTAGVRDGMPVLDDGRVLDVANVAWCTGFESDFSWIDLGVFDDEGAPLHDRGVVGSEPGLYFLGLYFLSAMASQLVGGAARDADYVVKHIASREAESLSKAGRTRRSAKAEIAA